MRLFASTRAHMWREEVTEEGDREWRCVAEPPVWDAIVSEGEFCFVGWKWEQGDGGLTRCVGGW